MTTINWAKTVINTGLRPLRIQIIRARSEDPAVQTFIPARKTIQAADRAGLSVGDYIDKTFAEPGVTAGTVAAMLKIADLPSPVERVCEIGAGSGRYMEKVIGTLAPSVYEVYETADDWLPHLRKLPGAVLRVCDGRTLAPTTSASVDLVHAQKVFVYLPVWTTASYLAEMARVVRPGGVVAFDLVTEECMDDDTVATWIANETMFRPVPRDWAISFLARRGLVYLDHHYNLMLPGRSELLVFRRQDS